MRHINVPILVDKDYILRLLGSKSTLKWYH